MALETFKLVKAKWFEILGTFIISPIESKRKRKHNLKYNEPTLIINKPYHITHKQGF